MNVYVRLTGAMGWNHLGGYYKDTYEDCKPNVALLSKEAAFEFMTTLKPKPGKNQYAVAARELWPALSGSGHLSKGYEDHHGTWVRVSCNGNRVAFIRIQKTNCDHCGGCGHCG